MLKIVIEPKPLNRKSWPVYLCNAENGEYVVLWGKTYDDAVQIAHKLQVITEVVIVDETE